MAEHAKPTLLGFGMANYRSFGPEGFVIQTPKKLNVFIGKNNCGKSNVLRVIDRLRLLRGNTQLGHLEPLEDHHRRGADTPSVIVSISAETVFTASAGNVQRKLNKYREQIDDRLHIRWRPGTPALEGPHPLGQFNLHELAEIHRLLTNSTFSPTPDNPDTYLQSLTPRLIQHAIAALRSLEPFLAVPVFREVRADALQGGTHPFNGYDVITRLRAMQHPTRGRDSDRKVFDKIERFLRDLVGTEARMEVPDGANEIIVNMHGLRLALVSFGTGIHHLVIMCAAFAIHEGHTVTIEEPEIHLHPELQRKFLRFIAEQTTNTYYITTHSNVFLDAHPEVSIYHVQYDGIKSTATHLDTTARSRDVLADMGYKASDLLQANCVIWVEGPSDRIYLNKWLSLVAPDLVEGIHYSVTFYGGKVLAHFSASDDPLDDLVQVLRINRHAILMIDRDGDDETAQLNANKQRIQAELPDGACWVTQGREIENYLPLSLVRQALAADYPGISSANFSSDDRIGEVLKAVGGPARYDKVAFARRFSEQMSSSDLDVLDLRARIDGIVGLIRQWNHADVPAASN